MESPYKFTVGRLTFYFSSEFYRIGFMQKYKENRKTINDSISKRFDTKCYFDELADLRLYRKIEKRGFRIKIGNEDYLCQNSLLFVGQLVDG